MYFDEDGELAHEFYEEVKKKNGGRKMRRVNSRNLVPQVKLEKNKYCRKLLTFIIYFKVIVSFKSP
jgi:hypothetical protein